MAGALATYPVSMKQINQLAAAVQKRQIQCSVSAAYHVSKANRTGLSAKRLPVAVEELTIQLVRSRWRLFQEAFAPSASDSWQLQSAGRSRRSCSRVKRHTLLLGMHAGK